MRIVVVEEVHEYGVARDKEGWECAYSNEWLLHHY